MASKLEDLDQLSFIDRHIQELEHRIEGLKARMAAMTLERYDIHNQEVLLITMLETRKDLEKFRTELARLPD
jgi:hypothetical protein